MIMNSHAKFFALLKQLPYADKDELVSVYSNNKTTSLREFSATNPDGYSKMLSDMVNGVNERLNAAKTTKENDTAKRRYRSLILRAMQEQGITVKGRDWSAVNEFVERYAGHGKSLSNMTTDELKKFNAQVHKLLDWHNAKIETNLRIATMN